MKHQYRVPNAPLGWRYVPVMVRDQDELRAIEIVQSMPGVSMRKIADALNAAGITNRRGEPFTHGSVQTILKALSKEGDREGG